MRNETESRWVTVGKAATHYLAAGSGPNLVLLHGGSRDSREWRYNIGSLAQSHSVYAPDFARGASVQMAPAECSLDHLVDFVAQFSDALGLERLSLVGHSMGGGVAVGFALRQPDRLEKLVLVDSAGLGPDFSSFRRLHETLCRRRSRPVSGIFLPPPSAGSSRQRIVFQDRLPEIQAPTLILWGRRDSILPLSHAFQAQRLLPRAQVYILDGCGHAPQRERPHEFNPVVLNFLKRGRGSLR